MHSKELNAHFDETEVVHPRARLCLLQANRDRIERKRNGERICECESWAEQRDKLDNRFIPEQSFPRLNVRFQICT